jgi:hypothetical protein
MREAGRRSSVTSARVVGCAAALFVVFGSAQVAAQNPKDMTPELEKVRQALDKYQDPIAAVHDGYFSTLGCVEYPKPGAAGQVPYRAGGMGVHFFNVALMGKIDPLKPQVLVYQPEGGKLRLVAAEYFLPMTPDSKERPQLFGRPFDGPMEGHHPLMPQELKHYDLHVWLWKRNPAGLFSPTNPEVKCPKSPYTFRETAPALVTQK